MRINEAPSRRSYETKVILFGQLPPSRLCQCSGATDKSPRLVKILTMSFYCVTLLIFNEIVFLSLLAFVCDNFFPSSNSYSLPVDYCFFKNSCPEAASKFGCPNQKNRNTILRGALIKITICLNDTGNFPARN